MWNQFFQFLTGSNAPWWSSLAAVALGGLITHLIQRSTGRPQILADREAPLSQLTQAELDAWKKSLRDNVNSLCLKSHETKTFLTDARAKIQRLSANEEGRRDRAAIGHDYFAGAQRLRDAAWAQVVDIKLCGVEELSSRAEELWQATYMTTFFDSNVEMERWLNALDRSEQRVINAAAQLLRPSVDVPPLTSGGDTSSH
jgi:hypothetical protein